MTIAICCEVRAQIGMEIDLDNIASLTEMDCGRAHDFASRFDR